MVNKAYMIENVEELIQPETEMEKKLLEMPELREGLFWGKPRFGHPEGKVLLHIREIMDNIDRLSLTATQRSQLRQLAIVHDAFKYKEALHPSTQHAILASRFMQKYTNDQALLTVLQWHDEAYFSWREIFIYKNQIKGQQRFEALLNKLEYCLQLYYLFFKCDTQTGDKVQAPLLWFEKTVKDIRIVTIK